MPDSPSIGSAGADPVRQSLEQAISTCRSLATAWRDEAACLRDLAAAPGLAAGVAAAHLRSAEAADRQAAWWEAGAADTVGLGPEAKAD